MANPNDPTTQSDWSFQGLAALSDFMPDFLKNPKDWYDTIVSAGKNAGEEFKKVGLETTELTAYIVKAYEGALAEIPQHIDELAAKGTMASAEYAQARAMDMAIKPLQDGLRYAATQNTEYAQQAINTLASITGMGADAVDRAEFGIDSVSARATRGTIDMSRELSLRKIELLDGTQRQVADFANLNELITNFARTALSEERLFNAAAGGINEKFILNNQLALDRLGMTTRDVQNLMQLELSATGKVTGQFLDEQMKVTFAAAEITGKNVKLFTEQMRDMQNDVKTFGMMSRDDLISLSNAMQELGMATQDVTNLASKFSSFDSAIQTVNNLTAATGATLDTMRLFELSASGDIEEFVYELRGQLQDAGVEYENLNKIQRNALASAFNIEPEQLQRFLNDNIEITGNIANEVASKAAEMSDEELQKRLASMRPIDRPSQEEALERDAKIRQTTLETAKVIEQTNSRIADSMVAMYDVAFGKVTALSQFAIESTKVARDAIKGLDRSTQSLRERPYFTPPVPPPVQPTSPTPPAPTLPAPPAPAPTAAATGTAGATTGTPGAPVAAPASNEPVVIKLLIETAGDVLKASGLTSGFTVNGTNYFLDLLSTKPASAP